MRYPYVALSYTWGQTSPTASAYIDKKPLRIRQNLFDFLQTYRNDPHNIYYVWGDQICIAQADVKERNSQVRLMPRIYSKCLEAIVWLGSNVRHLAWKLAGTAPLPMPALLKCKLATVIFRHEYFSRLWVIQETLLPPSVRMLCGDIWMPFEDLLEAYGNGPPAVYLHSSDKVARWNLEAAEGHSLLGFHDDIISAYRQPQRSFSLYHCVTSFACHRCSDDRDRIYGLLGLVPQDQRLAVDYSKTLEQVFLDVMMALMTRGEWNFSAHYISHCHQASRLSTYMGLDNHKDAIRALLKHLSDLGRSDKREEYGVGPGSERLCPSIVSKFTPGHDNTPDTWWCQHRGEIYSWTNESSGTILQQVRCTSDTAT